MNIHFGNVLLALALAGTLRGPMAARAGTLTVLNALDRGAGSLRSVLNSAKDGDKIVFDPSLAGQTITLISDQLGIKRNLDIEGPGADLLAISGNDINRVFDIPAGATVTISGLTITHGSAAAGSSDHGAGGGGGILNGGNLTVANAILSCNVGITHGGAIANSPFGVLTVTNSTFTSNQAVSKISAALSEGGAIYNSNHGSTATVIGCAFVGNRAKGGDGGSLSTGDTLLGESNGGAIHNGLRSTLIVQNSTFIGNQAVAGSGGSGGNRDGGFVGVAIGGAIANDENIEGAMLMVDGCTFAYNQAVGGTNCTGSSTGFGYIGTGRGGAIYQGGVGIVTNSAFIGNQALGGSRNTGGSGDVLVGVGMGGAIDNNFFGFSAVSLAVNNCMFTNNQALGGAANTGSFFVGAGIGGGIENSQSSAATITRCTLAGNEAIGGAGRAGGSGGDAFGGGVANFLGSSLTLANSALAGNASLGGPGGTDGSGGNGFGGGVFSSGLSQIPGNSGISPTLRLLGSTITANSAAGGPPGLSANQGIGAGGGAYSAAEGVGCRDAFTSISANAASTSNDDIFGAFTICP